MNEILSVIKKWMTRLLAGIATVLLSVMTLLVLYQVFTRYVLNSPAAFTEELVRYFLIWTGFIGAAYAFITREHMCLVLVRDSHRRIQAGVKRPEGVLRAAGDSQKPGICHGAHLRTVHHPGTDYQHL